MSLSKALARTAALGSAAAVLAIAGAWAGSSTAGRVLAQVPPVPMPGDTGSPVGGTIFVTVIDSSTATLSAQGLTPNATYSVQDCYPTATNPTTCVDGDPAQITTDDAGDVDATVVFDGAPGIVTIRLTNVNTPSDTYTANVTEPIVLPDGTITFAETPPLPQTGD